MRKLFFIALVLMVIGTVSFGSRDNRSICIIAKEWAVAKVEAGQLPATIEELNKYRVAYRRAAFETMSPDQRSSMWRQHITKFRASREFNAAQLALIDESLEFLKTAFHQKNDVQYEALKSQIPGLFPSKADQKQFALLGVPDNAPAVVGLLRNVGFGGGGTFFADCECRIGADNFIDDCPSHAIDCLGGSGCQGTWAGCGVFWLQPCNGTCFYGTIIARRAEEDAWRRSAERRSQRPSARQESTEHPAC